MRSLFVKPRANLIALMVASVPVLTILKRCIEGINSLTFLASFVSIIVGAPKLNPFWIAS